MALAASGHVPVHDDPGGKRAPAVVPGAWRGDSRRAAGGAGFGVHEPVRGGGDDWLHEASIQVAARQLRVSWSSIDRIMARAVVEQEKQRLADWGAQLAARQPQRAKLR
jgi:hypothetical protein